MFICVNFYVFNVCMQLILFPHIMINGRRDYVLCMKIKYCVIRRISVDNISVIQISTWYRSDIDHWSNCKALKQLSFVLVEFEIAIVISWCQS